MADQVVTTETSTGSDDAGKDTKDKNTQTVTVATGEETGATTPEKTFTQADINRLLADERRKTEAKIKADAESKRLEEEGQYKELLEKERSKVQDLADKIKQLEISSLKDKIGHKHGLPDSLISRLVGETEEEIEADAKIVKKALGTTATSDSPGTPSGGKGTNAKTVEDQKKLLASTGKYSL